MRLRFSILLDKVHKSNGAVKPNVLKLGSRVCIKPLHSLIIFYLVSKKEKV